MTTKSTSRGPLRRVLGALLAVAAALGLRRRVVAGQTRRRGEGGGTAGVREPRRPVPTPLAGAGAAPRD